jgi:PPOX class probable F420-dependent enzyme
VTTFPADVRRFFQDANFAHVATLLPDGSPHSVPVWVSPEGDRVAILTSRNSRKGRNLERDPRVAISVTAHNQPYATALVRGRVTDRVEGDAGWEIIDRMSHKYIGQPYEPRTDRVVYLIDVEWARAIAFG